MVDERRAGGGPADAISLSERILRDDRDQKRTRRRWGRVAALSVEDGPDGPVVTACTPEVVGLGKAGSAKERTQNRSGLVFAWTLERVDGRSRVADISASVPCTIEDVHYGLFAAPEERDAGSGGPEVQLESAADPTSSGDLAGDPAPTCTRHRRAGSGAPERDRLRDLAERAARR